MYGTSLTAGSDIARSDLLVAEIYPDATDATDQVSYQYNRQSQVKQQQDQNGNVHQYAFDGLGRTTSDAVTTLGAGVDGSVLRIDTAYEIRGMVNQVTSFSDVAGATAVNQVTLTYNQFEQLTSDAQNHSGAGGTPPSVGYGYADGAANTVRPVSITYPNGRVLNINYASGEDDSLSRVTSLQLSTDANPAVTYQYFGLGSIASLTYPQPGALSTLASGSSYSGLDQFGRIVNLPWTKTLTGDLAQLNYGYNLLSNRVYRQDAQAGTANEQDQIYAYDRVQRLVTFRQGALSVDGASYRLTNLAFAQDWNLDTTGNWSEFSQFDASDTSNGLDQQRTSSPFNQIENITTTVGTPWIVPTYDRNGNTTTLPDPDDLASGYQAAYDAWNRLVSVTTGGLSPLNVVGYQYDGLSRRIVAKSYNSSGTLVETRDLFYSDQWQVLEEDVDSAPEVQYVWGIRYVDDCVLRDRGHHRRWNI